MGWDDLKTNKKSRGGGGGNQILFLWNMNLYGHDDLLLFKKNKYEKNTKTNLKKTNYI